MARSLVPPLAEPFARRVKTLLSGRKPEWQYLGDAWPLAEEGWEHDSIIDAQLRKWPVFMSVVTGSGPLGIAHEAAHIRADDALTHNTIITFGYVLGYIAAGRKSVSVVDVGGGLGHYAVLAHALMPQISIDYTVVELAAVARAGRTVCSQARFLTSIDDVGPSCDLALSSGALQYRHDWQAALGELAMHGNHVFVTRLPMVEQASSYVVLQRPFDSGYRTEYPGWVLSRPELLQAARGIGLQLRREFLVAESHHIPGAPEQPRYRGFLFERIVGAP